MPRHHEIEITLKGNKALPPNPMPDLKVDDTVHYFCKGEGRRVTVRFPELSPYTRTDSERNTSVTDADDTVTVLRTGRFQCGCSITLENGETSIEWDPVKNPEAGGEHDVRD